MADFHRINKAEEKSSEANTTMTLEAWKWTLVDESTRAEADNGLVADARG